MAISAGRKLVLFVLAFALLAPLLTRSARAGDMVDYDSKYYKIHSDIDPKYMKEVILRMNRMAEEYHARTAGFSGDIKEKFPFFLYENGDDYYAAGGLPGSAGVFVGNSEGGKLMAIFGKHPTEGTWHVIQHEGFHQFAAVVIHANIPTWLNEGLAEYFGESIWTGDGFVTGIVPPWRLQRLKEEMEKKKLHSVRGIMDISSGQWAKEMSILNYDQAWSMTHFLICGDNNKYQPMFVKCLREASSGATFTKAWNDQIGPADGFDERWLAYWKDQPDDPTADLYARAQVATFTSFFARAVVQKQKFDDFHSFFQAASDGKLEIGDEDWLPPALLEAAVRKMDAEDNWTLNKGDKTRGPSITLKRDDGTLITGSYALNKNNTVQTVYIEVDDLAKLMAKANEATTKPEKLKMRDPVQASLKNHPLSPAAADAKKFLQSLR